jgi:hypothetical protein
MPFRLLQVTEDVCYLQHYKYREDIWYSCHNIILQHLVALVNVLICMSSSEGETSCRTRRLLACYTVASVIKVTSTM